MSTLATWVEPFVEQASNQAQNTDWLHSVRAQALERFKNEGWPTNRIEAWHHTSLMTMEKQSYQLAADTDASTALVNEYVHSDIGYWMVFVNGRFQAQLSQLNELPEAVQLTTVAQLLDTDPSALQDIYGKAEDGHSPDALNLALAQDGAFVRVASGLAVELPIHLLFVNTDAQAATFTRNFIALENGAQATVVEHYISTADYAGLTNAVTRVWVDQDAQLAHLKMQNQAEACTHLGSIDAQQEKASHYESHSLSFGAQLARTNIETALKGQHAHALLNGLYYANGRRHVDHATQIHHEQPNCTSHEYYRGVMADRGRGVFSGRIVVYEGADGTDAIQRSDSLLLYKLARADTRPELEIYADDVKCAHGATVGQIDNDSLFYLRSRGLSYEDAFNVLIYAFAAEVLGRIQSDSLRARATAAIQAVLPGAKQIGEQS